MSIVSKLEHLAEELQVKSLPAVGAGRRLASRDSGKVQNSHGSIAHNIEQKISMRTAKTRKGSER